MEAGPDLGREVVAAVDDGRGAGVGPPGLGLLVVRQGEHPQGEDLVDLGRVAEVAHALRRDRRVVVEDDRRRQHDVGVALVADEHREGAVVAAAGHRLGRHRRRIEQGHERAVVDGQQRVDGDQRVTAITSSRSRCTAGRRA